MKYAPLKQGDRWVVDGPRGPIGKSRWDGGPTTHFNEKDAQREADVLNMVSASGLSHGQVQVLLSANENPESSYYLPDEITGYKIQRRTRDSLVQAGLVKYRLAYNPTEREQARDEHIRTATEDLNAGRWQRAKVQLERAEECDRQRTEKRWFITDEGKAVLAKGHAEVLADAAR